MPALDRAATSHVPSLVTLSLATVRTQTQIRICSLGLGALGRGANKRLEIGGIRFKSTRQRQRARVKREEENKRRKMPRLPQKLLERAPLSFARREQTHLPTGNVKGPLFIPKQELPKPPKPPSIINPDELQDPDAQQERLRKRKEKDEIRERIREKARLRKQARDRAKGVLAVSLDLSEIPVKAPQPSFPGDKQPKLPIYIQSPTSPKTQILPPGPIDYSLPEGPLFTSEEICGSYDMNVGQYPGDGGKLYGRRRTVKGQCSPITDFCWNLFLISARSGQHWWNMVPIHMDLSEEKAAMYRNSPNLQFRPRGPNTRLEKVDPMFFSRHWSDSVSLPFQIGPNPGGAAAAAAGPSERWIQSNQAVPVVMPAEFIMIRRRIEAFHTPMLTPQFQNLVNAAVANQGPNNLAAVKSFLLPLVRTCALFDLVRSQRFTTSMETAYDELYNTLGLMERRFPLARGLQQHWVEWYPPFYGSVGRRVRGWMRDSVLYAQTQYEEGWGACNRDRVLEELGMIEDQIPGLQYPPEREPQRMHSPETR